MASSDELRFTVHGTGGHAALRNQLRDPIAAAAELVGGLLALNLPERVLSIGRIEADGATNVVPDDVRLEGTLRTFDEALRCASYDAIREIAASADRRYGTRTAVDIGRGYPCVVNDPALASLARSLAAERWRPSTCRCARRPKTSGSTRTAILRCSTGWASARRRGNRIHRPSRPTRRPSPRA